MEDDFDMKPRLRKLAMIGASVVATVVLAVVLLTAGGKGAKTGLFAKANTGASKWEYTNVLARCSVDRATTTVVCHRIVENDNTDLNGILIGMEGEGWQYLGVSNSSDKNGLVSAFMFKRPK